MVAHPAPWRSSPTTASGSASCASRARRSASRTCSSCRPASSTRRARTPLETAKRELAEEIGKGARTWRHLTSFYTSPGFDGRGVPRLPRHGPLRRERRGRRERAHRDRRRSRSAELDDVIERVPRRQDRWSALLWFRALRALSRVVAAARDAAPRGRTASAMATDRARPRRAALRAPGARLPRLPRVRARAVAQHARGLPLRPAAVRPLPRGAPTCRRSRRRPPTSATS